MLKGQGDQADIQCEDMSNQDFTQVDQNPGAQSVPHNFAPRAAALVRVEPPPVFPAINAAAPSMGPNPRPMGSGPLVRYDADPFAGSPFPVAQQGSQHMIAYPQMAIAPYIEEPVPDYIKALRSDHLNSITDGQTGRPIPVSYTHLTLPTKA